MADIPVEMIEEVQGMGVVGPTSQRRPPAETPEAQPPQAVQRENEEFSDRAVGRNVDVEA